MQYGIVTKSLLNERALKSFDSFKSHFMGTIENTSNYNQNNVAFSNASEPIRGLGNGINFTFKELLWQVYKCDIAETHKKAKGSAIIVAYDLKPTSENTCFPLDADKIASLQNCLDTVLGLDIKVYPKRIIIGADYHDLVIMYNQTATNPLDWDELVRVSNEETRKRKQAQIDAANGHLEDNIKGNRFSKSDKDASKQNMSNLLRRGRNANRNKTVSQQNLSSMVRQKRMGDINLDKPSYLISKSGFAPEVLNMIGKANYVWGSKVTKFDDMGGGLHRTYGNFDFLMRHYGYSYNLNYTLDTTGDILKAVFSLYPIDMEAKSQKFEFKTNRDEIKRILSKSLKPLLIRVSFSDSLTLIIESSFNENLRYKEHFAKEYFDVKN